MYLDRARDKQGTHVGNRWRRGHPPGAGVGTGTSRPGPGPRDGVGPRPGGPAGRGGCAGAAGGGGPKGGAEAVRGRTARAFPGASERRRKLGAALVSMEGGEPRALAASVL